VDEESAATFQSSRTAGEKSDGAGFRLAILTLHHPDYIKVITMMKSEIPDDVADAGGGDPASLTISEVSRRTGIPVAGLRNWEQRYGLPRPHRSPAGQRRYTEADCVLLADVQRYRASGLSLPAAMARASASASAESGPGDSIFAGLSRQHPDLRTHILRKGLLVAVSRAIEDECCARAQRPVLVGAFQRQKFYRASERRWAELARTAEQTMIFADFPHGRMLPGPAAEIPVPADSPMRREWVLVCDAPDNPACLTAWERPGQDQVPDQDRIFEALWSVDALVVRTATRISTSLAATAFPQMPRQLAARLSDEPAPASADLRRASGILERTLDYLGEVPRYDRRRDAGVGPRDRSG
jgi:DICT domain-containing protein